MDSDSFITNLIQLNSDKIEVHFKSVPNTKSVLQFKKLPLIHLTLIMEHDWQVLCELLG